MCPSSKKLRGLGVRAQARRISMPLLFSVAGVSSFLSPPRCDMRCGGESAMQGPGKGGAMSLILTLFKPLQRRCTVHISNRDINPGCVGTVHCCKAPLWGRRLDIGSLNLTPRFAYRLLLQLWLVVVKKRSQGVGPYVAVEHSEI